MDRPDRRDPIAELRAVIAEHESRMVALEAQGSRFWAVILELCGRLPESEPVKLAGDLLPLKVAVGRSGYSKSGLRRRIKAGELTAKKIGGRTFIRDADLPRRK